MSFVSSNRNSISCSKLTIGLDNNNSFIDKNDLDSIIKHRMGILKDKTIGEINLSQIEYFIANNPFVKEVHAFSAIDGELYIEVHQRVPLFRVFNPLNQSFYVDENGNFMPLSEKSSARVLMVNGSIYDTYRNRIVKIIDLKDTVASYKTMMDTLYTLANFIRKDNFFNALIQQVYVNTDRELELVPNIGRLAIILGDISDMDLKFKKLLILYKKGFSKFGWSGYNCINLKYKNQIVCTKIK